MLTASWSVLTSGYEGVMLSSLGSNFLWSDCRSILSHAVSMRRSFQRYIDASLMAEYSYGVCVVPKVMIRERKANLPTIPVHVDVICVFYSMLQYKASRSIFLSGCTLKAVWGAWPQSCGESWGGRSQRNTALWCLSVPRLLIDRHDGPDKKERVCVTGQCAVRCEKNMRWLSSNLGQGLPKPYTLLLIVMSLYPVSPDTIVPVLATTWDHSPTEGDVMGEIYFCVVLNFLISWELSGYTKWDDSRVFDVADWVNSEGQNPSLFHRFAHWFFQCCRVKVWLLWFMVSPPEHSFQVKFYFCFLY